jgi:hypothetical protein
MLCKETYAVAAGTPADARFEGHIRRVEKCKELMDMVYGKYSGENWRPKPYADNKSRYLWTDAFGVCNYITLFYQHGGLSGGDASRRFIEQADALIDDVHNTLGKTRDGKKRLGSSTDASPLLGGLRIGKEDEEGLPDGDGQYFHYLTKWMYALNRMSLAKNNPKYNNLAIQLAKSVHSKFVHERLGEPQMYWKMSIDLSRPLVPSEGNLDPYDGYVMYRLLQQTAKEEVLAREIGQLNHMVHKRYKNYRSTDLLDLGESLWLTQFFPDEAWAVVLTDRAIFMLLQLLKYRKELTSDRRLLFRECGTIMGLESHMTLLCQEPKLKQWVDEFIENSGGYDPNSCDKDITPVMVCACLNLGVWQSESILNPVDMKDLSILSVRRHDE